MRWKVSTLSSTEPVQCIHHHKLQNIRTLTSSCSEKSRKERTYTSIMVGYKPFAALCQTVFNSSYLKDWYQVSKTIGSLTLAFDMYSQKSIFKWKRLKRPRFGRLELKRYEVDAMGS